MNGEEARYIMVAAAEAMEKAEDMSAQLELAAFTLLPQLPRERMDRFHSILHGERDWTPIAIRAYLAALEKL